MPSPTKERDRAIEIARADVQRGLAAARAVSDPWFRVQAIAWVAWLSPPPRDREAVLEAFNALDRAQEPWQLCGAAAWPIRAAIEKGYPDLAREGLRRLLEASRSIRPPASRSEALFLLLQAAFPRGPDFWRPVFDQLVAMCADDEHWRVRRNLRDALLIVSTSSTDLARTVASSLPEGTTKRQVQRALESRESQEPRLFFWAKTE